MTSAIIVHSVRETRDLGRARLRFVGWAPGLVAGAEDWPARLASGSQRPSRGLARSRSTKVDHHERHGDGHHDDHLNPHGRLHQQLR